MQSGRLIRKILFTNISASDLQNYFVAKILQHINIYILELYIYMYIYSMKVAYVELVLAVTVGERECL